MYSAILSLRSSSLSLGDRNSTTKSGHRGAKPSCSSSLIDSQRSRLTHDASGERMAPFGSVKPAEESKAKPLPSISDHSPTLNSRVELRNPVFDPAGGMTMSSPMAVSSMRRSGLSRHNASNCSGDTL